MNLRKLLVGLTAAAALSSGSVTAQKARETPSEAPASKPEKGPEIEPDHPTELALQETKLREEARLKELANPERIPSDPASLIDLPRGPHHAVLRWAASFTNHEAVITPYTAEVIQLENGLNRKDAKGK